MDDDKSSGSKTSFLKVNKECPPEKEINILLLGETGIGKTTFINALANYFINNTLDDAIKDEIQVIIPAIFSMTDPETFEEKVIKIGDKHNYEQANEDGKSSTQQCRSFVFPVGNRNLRLIDTPGVGDGRGIEHDTKNLSEILTYISHYEHLNGICIFLRPNEQRTTIAFRLSIKEVLHYLHINAGENIIFIFTNARSTLYSSGGSKKLLEVILDEHRTKNNIEIPFTRDNIFLLDNEGFRYLAIHQNGIKLNEELIENYKKSWDHTIKEYERLLIYLSDRPLFAVGNELSLNGAEQFIRRLARPIAETLRLIRQNIQFARQCQQTTSFGLYQNIVQFVPLAHPKLVCISEKCSQLINFCHEKKMVLYAECADVSYLNGVIQEANNDTRIAQCEIIDNQTGNCTKCGCSWKYHMNTTYEYHTHFMRIDERNNSENNLSLTAFIEKRINDLQKEQVIIEDVCEKLSKLLHVNHIHSFNDNFLFYLQLYIREEQMKNERNSQHNNIINHLTKIMTNYEHNLNILKKEPSTNEEDSSVNTTDTSDIEQIFSLVGILYRLEINGKDIRYQTNVLRFNENRAVKRMETCVKLPHKATLSKIMGTFPDITASF